MMKRILLVAVIGLVAVFAFAGVYDAMKDDPPSAAGQAPGGSRAEERDPLPRPAPPGGPAIEIRTDDPPSDDPPKIEVGERRVLAENRHAIVMNPEPVDDGIWTFPPGSACRAGYDGRLTVVAVTDDRVLVRFTRSPQAEIIDPKTRAELALRQDEDDHDAKACPDGAVFFLDRGDYAEVAQEDGGTSDLEAAKRLLTPAAPVNRPRPKAAGKR